mgnify:CR=1 FL=1
MSRATDISKHVRVEPVAAFMQEYIDAAADEAVADVLNPTNTKELSELMAIHHEKAMERLHRFFVAWAENQ